MREFVLGSILATSVILASPYTFARDQISIVGSSTVYPFANSINSPQMDVSIQELYMALAKVLPNENGNLS